MMMLATQSYEAKSFAIIDIGFMSSMKMAKQQVMVKGVIRSIADGWTLDTTDEVKQDTLKLLLTRWENDILALPRQLWNHAGQLAVAQLTAIGIMASELPVHLQDQFEGTFFWSEQGRILDAWQAVMRSLAKRGLAIADSEPQVIST